jgi:hypothetical protein
VDDERRLEVSGETRRIAILGAGPIGLEAALYARALGFEPIVFERGEVAENVRRWGFVELFSPWSLNVSPLGLEALGGLGGSAPDPERCPSGEELRERYLLPLASLLEIRPHHEVLGIARSGFLKSEAIGGKERGLRPFRLLVRRRDGAEECCRAEIVIDATGVYHQPCSLGDGGLPAAGEEAARSSIDYHLPDILGAERRRFASRRVLLIGSGYSAATALAALITLQREAPATEVVWARRDRRGRPFTIFEGDPLPGRAALGRLGNDIAAAPPAGWRLLRGAGAERLERLGEGWRVTFRDVETGELIDIDAQRILALVGYRPDLGIHRELQVHHCYASEGPMKLAAALLGSSGGGDCLAQASFGPNSLLNPEPGFFIIGQKSYGRRSDFLLKIGREQVRDVFRLIRGDPELDLYAAGGLQRAGGGRL